MTLNHTYKFIMSSQLCAGSGGAEYHHIADAVRHGNSRGDAVPMRDSTRLGISWSAGPKPGE